MKIFLCFLALITVANASFESDYDAATKLAISGEYLRAEAAFYELIQDEYYYDCIQCWLRAKNGLGRLYVILGEYEKAAKYLAEVNVQAAANDFIDIEIKSLINLSYLYLEIGDFENSIRYTNEFISKSHENKKRLLKGYNNLGSAYYELRQIDSAEVYYKKALVIAEKLNNKAEFVNISNNLALVYCDRNKLDLAIETFSNILSDKNTVPDYLTLYNIATCYYKLGENDKAELLADSCFNFFSGINDSLNVSYCLLLKANALRSSENEKSIEFYAKALTYIPPESKKFELEMNIYSKLAEAYYDNNEIEEFYACHKNMEAYKDSIYDRDIEINKLGNEYSIMAAKETSKAKYEIELSETKAKNSFWIAAISILNAVLLAVVLMVVWAYYRSEKNKNKIIISKYNKLALEFSNLLSDLPEECKTKFFGLYTDLSKNIKSHLNRR